MDRALWAAGTYALPLFFTAAGILVMFTTGFVWRLMERRKTRESPLAHELLRPPGYSLRLRLDAQGDEVAACVLGLVLAPLLLYSMHVSQSYFAGQPETTSRIVVSFLLAIACLAVIGYRLIRVLDERRTFRLGLDGEMFTGEELNQLLLDGCRVFHDVPYPYGNIDHVVVSHSGVYAVNAKALQKPKNGPERAELTVDHVRNLLLLPDRQYPIPVGALEREARWLSQELSSATGQAIRAEPILALPGWYVKERIGRGPVFVINPQKPQRFFVQDRRMLDSERVQQIAHQLEQLCRDIKPAFRERKRWESE